MIASSIFSKLVQTLTSLIDEIMPIDEIRNAIYPSLTSCYLFNLHWIITELKLTKIIHASQGVASHLQKLTHHISGKSICWKIMANWLL